MKNLKIPTIKLQTVITIMFVVVIIFEVLMLYTQVYGKLSPEADIVPNENIVRLNLASYNQAVELLDKLRSFVVSPWNISNPNPF